MISLLITSFLLAASGPAFSDERIVDYPDLPGRNLSEISNGWQSDSRASLLPLKDGGCAAVFERNERHDQELPFVSHLAIAKAKDCIHYTPAEVLLKDENIYFADPKPMRLGHQTFLYYFGFNSITHEAAYYRSVWNGVALVKQEKLQVEIDMKDQLRAWFDVAVIGNRIVLTHEWRDETKKLLYMAWSKDGRHFGHSQPMNIGVMGKVSSFSPGPIIYTWQNGIPGQFMDFVQFMKRGGGWTEPTPITTQKDIHDVYPFRRLDGGIDLYYLTAPDKDPNTVFRRQLHRDGSFGVVERLTLPENDGSFEKPRPFRLPDGSVILFVSKQIWSEPNWNTDIWVMRLVGDAPVVNADM